MLRRDFINIVLQGFTILPLLTTSAAEANSQKTIQNKKSKTINIGELVEELQHDLDAQLPTLKDRWYAAGVENCSDKAVIMLPYMENASQQVRVITKYVQSLGFGFAVYGSNISKSPLYGHFIEEEIPQFKKVFGAEDKEALFKLGNLHTLMSIIEQAPRDILNNRPMYLKIRQAIDYYTKAIGLSEVPPYSDDIWKDEVKRKSYLERLLLLYGDSNNKRIRELAGNINAELQKNKEANVVSNLIGLIDASFNEEMARIFDRLGVSYVLVIDDKWRQYIDIAYGSVSKRLIFSKKAIIAKKPQIFCK